MGVVVGFSSATIRECACGADAGGIDCDGGFCSEGFVFGAYFWAVDSFTVATSNEDAPEQERHKTNPPDHFCLLQSNRSPIVRRILPLSFRVLRRQFVCLGAPFSMPFDIHKRK